MTTQKISVIPYEVRSIKGMFSRKLCWANKTSGTAMKPANETALVIDFKS